MTTITSHSPSYYVRKKFFRHKPAVFGLIIIIVAVIVALLGYIILPDGSPNANVMSLQLNMLHPMTTVKVLKVPKDHTIPSKGIIETMVSGAESPFYTIPINAYTFSHDSILIDAFTGLNNGKKLLKSFPIQSLIVLDGRTMTLAEQQRQVVKTCITTKTFILGSDEFGRDLLSRILIGTRISLFIGLVAVFISLLIGITMGAIAGFFRGKVDAVVSWIINVVWSIPTLLLVIAINMALGKGLWQVFIAVGLSMWVDVARIVRGQIFVIREMEYVEASRALGFTNARIIVKHILPNIMGPVIVITAANFSSAILLEAGLSFLGMGVQPPMPSWGSMIKEYYGFIVFGEGYLALIPGFTIMLLVLAFNFVGNGLRDAFETTSE